jgi:O-antigen ligase
MTAAIAHANPAMQGKIRAPLVAAAALLPWLHPFAAGPTPGMVPLLIAWACSAFLFWISPARWSTRWPGLLLVLGTLAAALLAEPQALAPLVACAAAVGCAAHVASYGAPHEALRPVALALLLAALASSAMGVLQYFGWTQHLAGFVSDAAVGEAFANLRQRNQFATLTSIGLCSALWLLRERVGLALACIVLLAIGNAASASRIGLLEWLMVFAFVLLWPTAHKRTALGLVAAGLGTYLAAALGLPALLSHLANEQDLNVFARIATEADCATRSHLWPNVLELIAARPLLGWGWGELDYAHYWHLYSQPRFCDILDNAHSFPLHLAVELGVPFAVLVCGGSVLAVLRARPWQEAQPERQFAWMLLAAIAAHSLVEYPLWYGPFQMALGFGVGLLWRRAPEAPESPPPHDGAWSFKTPLVAAALALLGWVGFDYMRVSQAYLPPSERWAAYRQDPLARIGDSRWFPDQVRFAALSTTPVTAATAADLHALALDLLHYSPEPKVIEIVLETALVLGRDAVVAEHLPRYRAAFPEHYQAWFASRAQAPAGSLPTAPR